MVLACLSNAGSNLAGLALAFLFLIEIGNRFLITCALASSAILRKARGFFFWLQNVGDGFELLFVHLSKAIFQLFYELVVSHELSNTRDANPSLVGLRVFQSLLLRCLCFSCLGSRLWVSLHKLGS